MWLTYLAAVLTWSDIKEASCHLSEPSQWQNAEVSLTGFAYRSSTGQWVLAESPNVRSCCVAAASKVLEQVALDGAFDASLDKKLITVEGNFHIDPELSSSALQRVFTLQNASLVTRQSSPVQSLAIASLAILALGFISFKTLRSSK